MSNDINLFNLYNEGLDKKFVQINGKKDLEVIGDILSNCKNLPFVGSFLKLGELAINTMDYFFFRKLSKFLVQSEMLPDSKKEEFLNSLSEREKDHISTFLIQLLYLSEEEEKAVLMGLIYKARLLNNIDNDQMLRLCSVIQKSFVRDLKLLPLYKESCKDDTIVSSNLINWGLINNTVGGVFRSQPEWKLSELGLSLYEILVSEQWFES